MTKDECVRRCREDLIHNMCNCKPFGIAEFNETNKWEMCTMTQYFGCLRLAGTVLDSFSWPVKWE